MDSTGGDLTHAADQVAENIEKRSLHDSSDASSSAGDVTGEKGVRQPQLTDTSSQDTAEVHKLDSKVVQVRDSPDEDDALAHLPPHERAIIKRQIHVPSVKVTFATLYRYATKNDLLILFVSAICAIVGGAVMPLMTVIMPEKQSIWLPGLTGLIGDIRPIDGHLPRHHAAHHFASQI